MFKVFKKIRALKPELKNLNASHYGDINNNVKELR